MGRVNSIPDIFSLTIFLVLQKVVFYTFLITRYKYCTCSFVYLPLINCTYVEKGYLMFYFLVDIDLIIRYYAI